MGVRNDLLSEAALSKMYAFLTNLNFITQSSGVVIDSEMPLLLSLDGRPVNASLVYDDEVREYELLIGDGK